MIDIPKKQLLTARLPATPCTPNMREEVEKIAKSKNIKLADLQRHALAFFLAQFATQTIIDDSSIIE